LKVFDVSLCARTVSGKLSQLCFSIEDEVSVLASGNESKDALLATCDCGDALFRFATRNLR